MSRGRPFLSRAAIQYLPEGVGLLSEGAWAWGGAEAAQRKLAAFALTEIERIIADHCLPV